MFAQTPQVTATIGSFRGQSIGSLRPKTIADLRGTHIPRAAEHGLVLVPQQATGLMVGRKQTPLGTTFPTDAQYGSAPVYKEHTFEFRPTGGMGEGVQSSKTDRRYHYAMDCWVTGGLVGLGPLPHSLTPANTGSIRRFVEALNDTRALALFALAGGFVLQRNDDTSAGQVVSRQRSATATDAARFTGAYSGAVDGLYVAWDDGVLEEYDGTSWKPCVLPTGFLANFLCVVGDELWAADSVHCIIRKCTNDPKVAGSWSGPILVGTPSVPITALRQTTNRLCIFKADGDVFTINGDGSDNDLFPGLQNTIALDNCRTAWPWQGSLWFRADRAFWRLDMQGGAVLSPEGPGRALGNLSDVKGPVQAFVGWNSQMAFGVIFNVLTNTSYLLTYGNWEPQQGDVGTSYAFSNQWDGAIAHWTNRKATCLWVTNLPSDARLYVGFDDGGYDYVKLVPYPFAFNAGAEFVSSGYIVAPIHHDMFQADNKQSIGFSVFGPSFLGGGSIDISYRLKGTVGSPPTSPSGDFISIGQPFTFNGERQNFTWPVVGVATEFKATFSSPTSVYTPVLEGIGLHERLVPAFRRDYAFTVDARDVTGRRDGASVRQSGRRTRDLMLQAAASPATVAIELPDETISDVAVFDYTERMIAHTAWAGQGWGVDVQVTEFGVTSTYGTIGRTRGTTIGSTRGWQISSLRRF